MAVSTAGGSSADTLVGTRGINSAIAPKPSQAVVAAEAARRTARVPEVGGAGGPSHDVAAPGRRTLGQAARREAQVPGPGSGTGSSSLWRGPEVPAGANCVPAL